MSTFSEGFDKKIFPNINLNIQPFGSCKNIFLFEKKLYTGYLPIDNYDNLYEIAKKICPAEKIRYLKFRGVILCEKNCTEEVFIKSDAHFFVVHPIEICVFE